MIERNDPCFCGSGLKWKKCHYPKKSNESEESLLAKTYAKQYKILIKTEEEIQGIRRACKLAAEILDKTAKMAKKGVTTNELNDYAHSLHIKAGAIPAPLHYGQPPYPKSICTSLNDVICHGIPNDIPLEEGDIVNIDVSPILDGFYGDCSKMVVIGNASKDSLLVVDVAHECLIRAIKILKPGINISEIGNVIESYATSKGCSVVHQFVGHGVGVDFHEPPQVLHYKNDLQIPLIPGMTFTIEPMINRGKAEGKMDANGWTSRTVDGKPSAQWEHTVLITPSGYEVLTLLEK